MDIVLVNPRPCGTGMNEATVQPPLGLGYIASVLEQGGFACKVIDSNVLRMPDDEVLNNIPEDVAAVGISLNSFTLSAVRALVPKIRRRTRNACIILGGPLPSAVPEMVLESVECDGLVIGEGEFAFLRIIQNIASGSHPFRGDIPGVVFRGSGNGAHVCTERISDLDGLPFPAYHLLPPLKAYRTRSRKSPAAAIVTSRGCPFGCSFCSRDVFGRTVTCRSAGNVLAEIDWLIRRFGVRQIDILDDNIALYRDRLENIMDGIIAGRYDIAVNMQTGIRTELLDEPLLKKMRKAGVYKLAFGVESADERVLSCHGKAIDLERVEQTARTARRLGFVVYGFFIVGLPGETDEGFEKTLAFARRVAFDVANFCLAVPFVGTDLYRMVEERGRFLVDTTNGIDSGFYDGRVFFEYEGMGEKEVLRRYKRAYGEFYSPARKIQMLLGIRSWGELLWMGRAFFSVRRGMGR